MPSFDIVSKVDEHELTNTLDQANREVANRFDFRGVDASFTHQGEQILLEAEVPFQLEQMLSMLYQKAAKRGIDVASFSPEAVEQRGQRARQPVKIQQGINQDLAKKIVKHIKDAKLKVQTAVQGDTVRVTGKKRDDLQQVIATLRETDLGQPLQFENFRD